MPISAGEVQTKFTADTRELDNAYRRAEDRAQQYVSKVNSTLGGIGSGIGGSGGFLPGLSNISNIIQGLPQIGQLASAIVRPLTDATREGIKFNAWLESTRIGFNTLMGGADAAKKHLDELRQYAIGKPFTFQGLVESSQYMQALGFDAREVIPSLTAIGDALSASGKMSQDAMEGIIRSLGQMRAKGRVSAEEMNQLAERNINGFELLAKATGKSEAQLRKLAEAGRLNARVATELILKQIEREPKYAGAMERQAGTLNARLSDLEDLRQQTLGRATEDITANFNRALGAALERGDLAQTMASGFNAAISPVSGVITNVLVSGLEGGITAALPDIYTLGKDLVAGTLASGIEIGLEGGIQKILDARRNIISGAVGAVAGEGAGKAVGSGLEKVDNAVVGGAKMLVGGGVGRFGIGPDALAEIESIAQRAQEREGAKESFIGFGIMAAEGFKLGFGSSLTDGAFDNIIERFLGRIEGNLSKVQERAAKNLTKLMQREPEFMPKLKRMAAERGMNPDHILNAMAVETAGTFNPQIRNPTSSASGMIQFMRSTAPELGTTIEAIRRMNATEQLDYVFKYFDTRGARRGRLNTQGAVYAAIGAGHAGASDESVLMRRGDRGYAGNAPTWDVDRNGIIQPFEFAKAAYAKLGAGIKFTVGGDEVSRANPLPVYPVVTSDIQGGSLVLRPEASRAEEQPAQPPVRNLPLPEVKSLDELMRSVGAFTVPSRMFMHGDPDFGIGPPPVMLRPQATKQQQKEDFDRLVIESNRTWGEMRQGFESAMLDGFHDVFDVGFKRASANMLISFTQALQQMAMQAAAARIGEAIFGKATAEGGFGGGLLDQLLGRFGIGEWGQRWRQGRYPKPDTTPDILPVQAPIIGATAGPFTGGVFDELPPILESGFGLVSKTISQEVGGIHASINNSTTMVASAVREVTNTMIALQPQQPGFWGGLLNAVISGATQGLIQAVDFGGSQPRFNNEGPITGRPTTPPILKSAPRRAGGGDIMAGQGYLVGEHGPEFFRPDVPGRIYNRSQAAAIDNAPRQAVRYEKATPQVVHNHNHFNFHITAPAGSIPRQTQEQMAGQFMAAMANANRRRGETR